MNTINKRNITIVGGGFSGLSLAYFLVKLGFNIQIIEKKNWGGLISTRTSSEMLVETAANAFLNSALLQDVAKDIGCELLPTLKQAKKRFIFRSGLRQWPVGFKSSWIVFRFVLKYLFNKNILKPYKLETVTAWSIRVLNDEILNYLIAPVLQGIYAGNVNKMSATLIFGSYFEKSKKDSSNFKKGSVAPSTGMGAFINALKIYLEKNQVQFLNEEIKSVVGISKPLVLAVSVWDVANLYDATWAICEPLPVMRVSVGFLKPKNKISGFGVLFPAVEKFNSLGVLSNTNIFANRGDLYNESWILAGAKSPELLKKTDHEILKLISDDRNRIFGSEDQIINYEVIRWQQGIPHYTVALENFLQTYQQANPNIYLTGNYLGKIGLSKILKSNQELAIQLKEKYG
ncbi:MAG: FAD-dependent oxidoreductase [Pseudobdellovibrio sp.]